MPPFWTKGEMELLDRGLETLNLVRKDLGFPKRPIDDPFRLPIVDRILDDPLRIGDEAGAWDACTQGGDPVAILHQAAFTLDGGRPPVEFRAQDAEPYGDLLLGEEVRNRLALLGLTCRKATDEFRAAFAPSGDALPSLLRKALLSQVEKPSRAPAAPDIDDAAFLAGVRAWNMAQADDLARVVLRETAALVAVLRGEGVVAAAPREVQEVGGIWGTVVVYGTGDDVHDAARDARATVILDLGGNDTWTRGAFASAFEGRTVAVAIDLSGNDRYVGREDLSFGAALGGVAIQWDVGGDDFWDGGHASLGAGIAGVGVLVDEGGDDVHRSRDFGQGAGAFGIGILLDTGGNDLRHVDLYGQGFASVRGCGVLADLDGNDVYDAGGVHVHAPLYADRHQSLSQGFSIGMRPDASGGVGVLVDRKGNDRYAADIYGQGSSYWYSLGLLVDGDGNDTYSLGQYGQGSGIHLSAGMLLDRAGSDAYYLKNGVGMGGAHDWSVGVLLDRGGDDYYAGSGGTQGGALTNSVAILLDGGGNDGYAAVNPGGAQGGASPARGTGGIGLLLDAGGADVYTEKTRDGAAWTKEWMGAGLDEPAPPAAMGVGDPGTTAMTPEAARAAVDKDGRVDGPDGKPVDDLDRLWEISKRWEVGDNRIIVPVARERLVALGRPALDRALSRVGTKDGLEFRAVETTAAAFPAAEVVPLLLEKTSDADPLVRRGAVRVLGGLKPPEAIPRLAEMLAKDPETRGAVLAALAAQKAAPAEVIPLLRAPKDPEAVQAVLCLAAAGEAHLPRLAALLGPDTPFLVRVAALERLSAAGAAAVPLLAGVASDETQPPMARRNAIRALGRSKAPAAVAPVAAALKSPDRRIRLSAFPAAAELLDGLRADPGHVAARAFELTKALEEARAVETDPLVGRIR